MLTYICSQPLHMKCLESACFTLVTQMLPHQLCNSLYLTFTFFHSQIAKLNALADLNWKPMQNESGCADLVSTLGVVVG